MKSRTLAGLSLLALAACSPNAGGDGDGDDGFIGSAGSDGGRSGEDGGDRATGERHFFTDGEGQLPADEAARLESHLAEIEQEIGEHIHVATRGDNASYEHPDCRPESPDQSCAEALLLASDAAVIVLADLESGDVVLVPTARVNDRFAGGYLDEVLARMTTAYQSGGNIAALTAAADGVADAWRGDGAGEQGYSDAPAK